MYEVLWVLLAFLLGFAARMVKLPPLVGFLLAGFVLNGFGVEGGNLIEMIGDFGVQLLLFTIGLKLDLRNLAKPSVWGVTSIHMGSIVVLFGGLILVLTSTGLSLFTDLTPAHCFGLGFALSFSSTVFAVKVLEDSGQMSSQYGNQAIGILIVQDIFAIVFMTLTAGKMPSVWALLLFGLPLVRPLLLRIMTLCGHGELLVLLGILFALGGAELFALVNLKPDLGPLVFGVLVGAHPKAKEMAQHLFGFKEVFLIGFFLSIGLSGSPTWTTAGLAVALVLLVPIKTAGFFLLMSRFRVTARTSFLASLTLSNYSEFGLIVGAVGVKAGWWSAEWLIVAALALSLSFIVASAVNSWAPFLFEKWTERLKGFETEARLPEDEEIDGGQPEAVIFGMGAIGVAAYDELTARLDGSVLGVDSDAERVKDQKEKARNVIHGDPLDLSFSDRIKGEYQPKLMLITFRNFRTQCRLVRKLRKHDYHGRIVVLAEYADQCPVLLEDGADAAYDYLSEVGAGFADHALH